YFARQFLAFAFAFVTPEWSLLRAETVAAFVQKETAHRQGAGRKHPGSATRIFLRYLVTRGLIPAGLEAVIPSARPWKHASLPEHLPAEDVSRVLAAWFSVREFLRRWQPLLNTWQAARRDHANDAYQPEPEAKARCSG